MATKPSSSSGSKVGKAVLWGTGLASLPGIAKTVATPVKDLATDTRDGLRRNTPTLQDAKAAWQLQTEQMPEARFTEYARKMALDEPQRVKLARQYQVLTILGVLVVLGSLALTWWNLSGILLAAMAAMFTLACDYRRDCLHRQRLPTMSMWMKERMWWIFG